MKKAEFILKSFGLNDDDVKALFDDNSQVEPQKYLETIQEGLFKQFTEDSKRGGAIKASVRNETNEKNKKRIITQFGLPTELVTEDWDNFATKAQSLIEAQFKEKYSNLTDTEAKTNLVHAKNQLQAYQERIKQLEELEIPMMQKKHKEQFEEYTLFERSKSFLDNIELNVDKKIFKDKFYNSYFNDIKNNYAVMDTGNGIDIFNKVDPTTKDYEGNTPKTFNSVLVAMLERDGMLKNKNITENNSQENKVVEAIKNIGNKNEKPANMLGNGSLMLEQINKAKQQNK